MEDAEKLDADDVSVGSPNDEWETGGVDAVDGVQSALELSDVDQVG